LAEFEEEWRQNAWRSDASRQWLDWVTNFSGEDAFDHVTALSGQNLSGRRAGTPGAEIAANYIANRFKQYGLQPAGDLYEGSYFQSFPITFTMRVGEPRLQFLDGSAPYEYRTDFLSVYATLDSMPVQGPLIWLDSSVDDTLDLSGQVGLMVPSQDIEEDVELARNLGAKGLLLLGSKRETADLFAKHPLVPSDIAEIPVLELSLEGTMKFLEHLDHNYTSIRELPAGTPMQVEAQLVSVATVKGQVSTTNVLGVLPGSDPLLSREVIVIGAHYDHVGDDPPPDCKSEDESCGSAVRYSGQNDNASGIGVMLEIAQLWQEVDYRPKRTILFAAWGAQESGQLGSGHYVGHPTLPLSTTMGMVQLDGMGGGDGFYPGLHGREEEDAFLIHILTTAAEQLDEKVVVAPSSNESDHQSFRLEDIPAMLVSWRLADENNLPDGLANGVSPERLATSGRMVALAMMVLAR
jgi:hypothetical protein